MAVPDGYLVFRDGVQIDVVETMGATEYVDSTVSPDTTYSYQVAAAEFVSGDWMQASELSEALIVHTPVFTSAPGEVSISIVGFDDEAVFQGFLGARLRGKVVACPGRRVGMIKPKC